MAKKEYIERGLAMQIIMSAAMERGDYLSNPCIGALGKVPAADVEEVRYGEWIPYLNEYKGYVTSYNCSLCGRRVTDKEPYCHCGAKMDKEG